MGERPMVIFVSDIHLTDALHNSAISRKDAFERFWIRIAAARGQRPAHLVFCGDLFDLVRSPSWLDGAHRPYHEPDAAMIAEVDRIVAAVIDRERDFFDAIKTRVETGELEVHYTLGNHDRLLRFAPKARRAIWKALTGRDEDVVFPSEIEFPEHGVLAYHGHVADDINHQPDGAATIGDAIGSELIVRFPRAVRLLTGEPHPELDDIDDVRPVYAVPAWVRQLGTLKPELLRPINDVWSDIVESFLSRPYVKHWMKSQKSHLFGFDTGTKLRLLLELSTKKLVVKGSDKRLTELYKVMQHAFDGRMAKRAMNELEARKGRFRFVVNGHSHFPSMVPLGQLSGRPAVYFNTGTWRSVHQIGHGVGGRPAFLPYDAMSYLVFFPDSDPLGRDYEWWTGAMVARRDPEPRAE
jgi:UDP-2,3-diacylglucosamine pyrophosphatase LpxH